jgi:glycerophosphoryl diester phosphodiesterase
MVKVTGHRGAAGLEPENTLRSFQRALNLGVDAIELDVHLTKDQHLVVIHDATVDRTTNGSGAVRDLTLHEIQQLDAGLGEHVPTLQEVIDLVAQDVILQIELKGLGVEHQVAQTIAVNRLMNHVTVTSFRHNMVKTIKTLNPQISTGVLFLGLPIDAPHLAHDAQADAVHPHVNYIDTQLVESCHSHGLSVRVWNTDDPSQMQHMIALNVDAIGSNRPDLLLQLLNRLPEGSL